MRKSRYYVISCQTCDVPGCNKTCVAMDILVSNGKRCVDHIPSEWTYELDRNAYDMFGRQELSNIFNYKSVMYPETKKNEMLDQKDVDALIKATIEQEKPS